MLKELELPEFINGLESKNVCNILQPNEYYPSQIETFRLFQNLYFNISYARYSLYQACEEDHSKEFSSSEGVMWLRCFYCNNALILYNSCFDLLLQTIWIYKELYVGYNFSRKSGETKSFNKITTSDLSNIYKGCSLEAVNKQYKSNKEHLKEINKFNTEFSKVRNWANALKHRNGITYKQLYTNSPLGLIKCNWNLVNQEDGTLRLKTNDISYNSSETIELEDINEITTLLIKYHKEFYKLITSTFANLGISTQND